MFACFGLKAKHKRLSEVELLPEKYQWNESTKKGRTRITDSNPGFLTDSPLLKINDSPPQYANNHHTTSSSVPRSTQHGTPLPKRASFRRRKIKRNFEAYVNNVEYPVKAARPSTTTTTTTTTTPHRNNVSQRAPVHPPSTPTLADQLKKVEEELEERGVEIRRERDLKVEVERRVEALTVLLHHINTKYDPFCTPRLKGEIHHLSCQLTETRLCLDETSAALRRLQETERETEKRHRDEIEKLQDVQKSSLEKLLCEHKLELNLAQEKHRKELSQFAEDQQTQRETVSRAHVAEVEQLDGEWRAKIDLQHEKHLCAVQELNTKHIAQVREIETTRQARQRELEEANYRLREEHESLKSQSKKLEETLLNDTDHRLAAVRRMCTSLKSEVDSLKSVVDMKNAEIHSLRSQVVEVDRLTLDLELSRERARSLQAKTEDLQAQMEKKAQQERSLVNEHRQLVETYQRESNVNKRLSLENEELAWKLKEKEEIIMCMSAPSPATHSSLDLLSTSYTPPKKEI